MRWLCALFLLLTSIATAAAAEPGSQSGKPPPIHDHQLFWYVLLDNFEYQARDGTDAVAWEAKAWVGGDFNRLWLKTEGERSVSGDGAGELEVQLLYGRMLSPFWDLQAGIRQDRTIGKGADEFRTLATLALQGTAPYRFELEPALFLSRDGGLSFRLGAEWDLLILQRLAVQPSFEMNGALRSAEKFGVGRGLNDLEFGLRIRYEVWRELAPYLGIVWKRKFGQTADLAREEKESVASTVLVGGVRIWF